MKKKIFILLIAALIYADYAKPQACTNPLKAPNPSTVNNVPVISSILGCVGVSQITDNIDVFIGTGSIDLSTALSSYKIGTLPVLWHNNIPTSIYLGVGAGNALGLLNFNNTFVGNNAGTSNINANSTDNTFIGFNAGFSNNGTAALTPGNANTFVGSGTGQSNGIGFHNTFIGYNSGASNLSGSWNTCTGINSGLSNTTGGGNCFYGKRAGLNNLTGGGNDFYGSHSGENNVTGNLNVAVGHNAAQISNLGTGSTYLGSGSGPPANSALNNATAIGYTSLVMHHDEMILGGIDPSNSHSVNVGIGLSGEATAVGNRLEINSIVSATPTIEDGVANGGGGTGFSGLRFRDLTSSSTPYTNNPGLGVLSVDGNGDVIYVPVGGGVTAQNAAWINGSGDVEWGTNPLIQHTEIPMIDLSSNEWNIYFSGQSTQYHRLNVGIGRIMLSPLEAKLDVLNNTNVIPGHNFTTRFAGRFWETGTYLISGNDELVGVAGICDVRHTLDELSINLGGDFTASNATFYNIGARGTIKIPDAGHNAAWLNVGLWGEVIKLAQGPRNYGVYGFVKDAPNTFCAGVYGHTPITGGLVGSVNFAVYGDLGIACPLCLAPPCNPPCQPPTAPDFAGYFNGDLLSTTAIWMPSDANLKQNIQDFSNPLETINQLQVKSFTYNQDQNQSMRLPSGTQVGLLAQGVYAVAPQLTKDCVNPARYDSLGNETFAAIQFKSINYPGFVPYLIGGMQQQQAQLNSQQAQIDSLIEIIGNTELPQQQQNPNNNGNGNGNGNQQNQSIVLSGMNEPYLGQNIPNPFSDETRIDYYIPETKFCGSGSCQIIFYDQLGRTIEQASIEKSGYGTINVSTKNLANGILTYKLLVNGEIISVKKMVFSK